jgi:hypothetical protein
MGKMARIFEELSFLMGPRAVVAELRNIRVMKSHPVTPKKPASEKRLHNEQGAMNTNLGDPDEIRALPGRLQVGLVDKKLRNYFRKGIP